MLHDVFSGKLRDASVPERKGQTGGRLDPAVVALNGAGLILYLVPGLIAFAVDFHNGTIYLPSGGLSDAQDDVSKPVSIPLPVTDEKIEQVINEAYGMVVELDNPSIQHVALRSLKDLNSSAHYASLGEKSFEAR